MKSGEGLQPVSPPPADRVYSDLLEVAPEVLAEMHAGFSGLTKAMGGEVTAGIPEPHVPSVSPLNMIGRAGLSTLINAERRVAEFIGIDTTGI